MNTLLFIPLNSTLLSVSFWDNAKSIAEFTSDIGGSLSIVAVLATIVLGVKQIKYLKAEIEGAREDFSKQMERESVDKTIEYLTLYATVIIKEIQLCNGVEKNINELNKIVENKSSTSQQKHEAKATIKKLMYEYRDRTIHLMNQLEFFSAAMVTGLASEELAYIPLSNSFCRFYKKNKVTYDAIRENEDQKLYYHTIELYNRWENRRKLEEAELAKAEAEAAIAENEMINPISIIGKR